MMIIRALIAYQMQDGIVSNDFAVKKEVKESVLL